MRSDRWRRLAAALVLFGVTWGVYARTNVAEGWNLSDPLLNVPTSLSLIHDHDLALDEFAGGFDPSFYGVIMLDGRPYNRYPIGAALVTLPLVWLADSPAPAEPPMQHALRIAAVVAKVTAALAVAFLFLFLAHVTTLGRALGLALVFAFATPQFPIHAGGLWTHNVATTLVVLGLLLLVVRDGRDAWAAAIPFVLAFVTRPTTAPTIALLSVYVACRRPRAFPAYALIGGIGVVLYCLWSRYMYGTILPPYYLGYTSTRSAGMHRTIRPDALVGNLVSPNRGLFVFAPVFVFSLWGMARSVLSGPNAALYRTVAVILLVHWVMISTLCPPEWWAGWSFGPRNFMDVMALFVVLLVPALDALATLTPRSRAVVGSVGAAALAWSLFVAVHGATSVAPAAWNSTPVPIDGRPERVWDWRDMQILRGVLDG